MRAFRVVSRFGRAIEFSVRDVPSVSRSLGWIVLYDKEFKTLEKVDSYLETLDRLKGYLAFQGIDVIYNCYYLMELENDSWLCVYFDDYLALTGVGDFRLAMYQHGKVNWLLDVMLQIATFSCCHEGVGYRPF